MHVSMTNRNALITMFMIEKAINDTECLTLVQLIMKLKNFIYVSFAN